MRWRREGGIAWDGVGDEGQGVGWCDRWMKGKEEGWREQVCAGCVKRIAGPSVEAEEESGSSMDVGLGEYQACCCVHRPYRARGRQADDQMRQRGLRGFLCGMLYDTATISQLLS